MERKVGTVSRGIRCPIIREGDNLAKIVSDSVLEAAESEGFSLRDRDVISVTECQCYPVNAKYYLSLDGLSIGIHTRSRNPEELTETRKLEIVQMFELTNEIKSTILK